MVIGNQYSSLCRSPCEWKGDEKVGAARFGIKARATRARGRPALSATRVRPASRPGTEPGSIVLYVESELIVGDGDVDIDPARTAVPDGIGDRFAEQAAAARAGAGSGSSDVVALASTWQSTDHCWPRRRATDFSSSTASASSNSPVAAERGDEARISPCSSISSRFSSVRSDSTFVPDVHLA